MEIPSSLKNYEVPFENLLVSSKKSIGNGSYGKTYIGTIKGEDGTQYALKKIDLKSSKNNNDVLLQLFKETQILSLCKHPFVLSLRGFSIQFKEPKHQPISFVIITELCNTQYDLQNFISRPSSLLNSTQITIFAMGIAAGIAYLHRIGIIHRDIKANNILLKKIPDLPSKYVPVICDFGFARKIDISGNFYTKHIGTPQFMAPEVIHDNKYTELIDVYSYGIILYQLLTKKTPYSEYLELDRESLFDDVKSGKRPSIPENCKNNNKTIVDLIEKCWNQDPSKRPTMESVYSDFAEHRVAFDQANQETITQLDNYLNKLNKTFLSPNIDEIPKEDSSKSEQESKSRHKSSHKNSKRKEKEQRKEKEKGRQKKMIDKISSDSENSDNSIN